MNFNLDFQHVELVALVPVIVAIVQAFKMVGLPNKYSPLVSIGVGIILAFITAGATMNNFGEVVLNGMVYGLSASGLYSGTKTTAHAIKGENEVK